MLRNITHAALLAILFPQFASAEESAYKIGVSKSVFRDVPENLAKFAGQPFQDLMKEQTGLNGEIVQEADPMKMAEQIQAGKLHFGVFPGHEFAWAQEKYPELTPLIRSIYRPAEIKAVILVRHDCKAMDVRGMKGSRLAIATTVRDHARLFWDRQCGSGDERVTCAPEKVATVHDGIHKVLDGEADITIADFADWSYFQKLYPGPSKGLKTLAQSEEFPATVLVYKKGAVAEEAIKKIRQGFLTAHENRKAANMMKMIRIERFADLPEQYAESLATCRKLYPKPLADR